LSHPHGGILQLSINMSTQPNVHKRGRSVDQRSTYTSEKRFLTSGVEVEIEEPRSDSEYDSDVIVVGKGRKCPRISETPPNHAPSAMRMLPAPPSSPQPQGSPVPPPETLNRDPGQLEWYPNQIHTSYPLAIEVQKLRAQVGHLELEATRNIELRSELQENYCKIVSEARELRETVTNLAEKQKLEELRRHLEANRWGGFENTIISKIEARKSDEIERELQLSRELNEAVRREIDRRWMGGIRVWEGVARAGAVPVEGITTCDNPPSPMRPMEGITIDGTTMPTIEGFSGGLISSGGLDDSRHVPNRAGIGAPDSGRDLQTGGNSGDPPSGPSGWSKKMGRQRGESKKRKCNKKNRSTQNTRLHQLEAEISNLKDKIKEKEKRRNDSANRTTPSQTKPTHTSDPSGKSSKPTAEERWTLVDRRRKTRKPTFEQIKLVICGMDNGHRNLTELKAEITHKVMAKYIKWEYHNRQLLRQRGHSSGGVYITVFNRQDADLLIRKGIRAYGQRHQIKPFSRASLTDQCKNCHQHGHLERSCLVEKLINRGGKRQQQKHNGQYKSYKANSSPHASWR
jgi:hypothetical protein